MCFRIIIHSYFYIYEPHLHRLPNVGFVRPVLPSCSQHLTLLDVERCCAWTGLSAAYSADVWSDWHLGKYQSGLTLQVFYCFFLFGFLCSKRPQVGTWARASCTGASASAHAALTQPSEMSSIRVFAVCLLCIRRSVLLGRDCCYEECHRCWWGVLSVQQALIWGSCQSSFHLLREPKVFQKALHRHGIISVFPWC